MTLKSFLFIPFLALTIATAHAGDCFEGDCGDSKVCGKVELSGVYIHIDLLDDGETVDRMDLPAIKGDACWSFFKGLVIKPTFMWGKNDKELFTTGAGLGQIIPVGDCFYVTPIVGINYTYMKTDFSMPQYGIDGLDQTFKSYAPYLAVEFTYNITSCFRTNAQVQYAWTRNHSRIKDLSTLTGGLVGDKAKESSRGWSYGMQLEYDLNKCWSINAGGAYNSSYSKEKRGLRGYGFKIGLARWF